MIEDIPEEAKKLALIVDDPDAPMGTWVHWVVFNISKKMLLKRVKFLAHRGLMILLNCNTEVPVLHPGHIVISLNSMPWMRNLS